MKRILCGIVLCVLLASAVFPAGAETLKVGSYITFGSYEQNDNNHDGKEPIEWLVLDVDNSAKEALVISRYILDVGCFQDGGCSTLFPSWEKSSIRKWLNETFLQSAFTSGEQRRIARSKLSTPDHAGFDGGKDTTDRVFLLSRDEAEYFFQSDSKRLTTPTTRVLNEMMCNAYTLDTTTCYDWWLRSPGYDAYTGLIVADDGCVYGSYFSVYFQGYGIRPAMRITY